MTDEQLKQMVRDSAESTGSQQQQQLGDGDLPKSPADTPPSTYNHYFNFGTEWFNCD